MTRSAVIQELLEDRRYHIEFNGHLTNHAKHAVIALAGLGASCDRIQGYYDRYAELTPYGSGLEPPRASAHTITDDNWQDFLGRRTSFAAYCAFFDQKEQKLGLNEVLRRYAPLLVPGWVGSFTHAAIHLGWALDVKSRWMAIEGLAYLAFSNVSCHPNRWRPAAARDVRPIDSLLRIMGTWDDEPGEFQWWVRATISDISSRATADIHPELARSGLQYRIARLLIEGHPSFYEAPTWIDEQDVRDSWEQLYYLVALLYLTAPGNFVVLHLITSLYGMEKIAERFPEDQQRYVLRCFWTGMFAILLSEGKVPERAPLEALHALHGRMVDGGESTGESWERIVARAIDDDDEHNPKMVYVLRQLWRRTSGRSLFRLAAARFTSTPELPVTFRQPPTE